MGKPNLEKEQAEFMAAVAEMYAELRQWRANHPRASFDEIAAQVTPRRRELMGQLLNQLVRQHGDGEVVEWTVPQESEHIWKEIVPLSSNEK